MYVEPAIGVSNTANRLWIDPLETLSRMKRYANAFFFLSSISHHT